MGDLLIIVQDSHTHRSSGVKAMLDYLHKYQESSATMVYDRWWNFFFDMVSFKSFFLLLNGMFQVGKYRDMYMIDYPNTDDFNDAYTYLSTPRWYYEMIGYWGAPFTPPPGEPEHQPVGV